MRVYGGIVDVICKMQILKCGEFLEKVLSILICNPGFLQSETDVMII